jgi:hypothetical protein
MSWFRKRLEAGKRGGAESPADPLEQRLLLRLDELAADASALRAYVDEQLARLTSDGPVPAAEDFFAGALSERIGDCLAQVDAALDRIDGELHLQTANDAPALLQLVRTQSAALRALAAALREVARIQLRRRSEGQSEERR